MGHKIALVVLLVFFFISIFYALVHMTLIILVLILANSKLGAKIIITAGNRKLLGMICFLNGDLDVTQKVFFNSFAHNKFILWAIR